MHRILTHTHTHTHTKPISPYRLTHMENFNVSNPTKIFMLHFEMTSIVIQKNHYFIAFSLDVMENYVIHLILKVGNNLSNNAKWVIQTKMAKATNKISLYSLSNQTIQAKSKQLSYFYQFCFNFSNFTI